jgi:competence protein ComEC
VAVWFVPVVLAAVAALHGAGAIRQKVDPPILAALGASMDSRTAAPVWMSGILREDAAISPDGVSLLVDVDRVNVEGADRPVRGRVQIGVSGDPGDRAVALWTRGRRIGAPVLVRRPQIWLNPGGPSERWQTLRRPFDLAGTIKSAQLIDVSPGSWLAEVRARARRHLRTSVRDAVGEGSAASVVTAILIGDRTGLAPDTIRGLQMAGTYHVIAISGGNIAIVVLLSLSVLRLVIRSPRAIALAAIAVVTIYGGVVAEQASVERAVGAAVLVLSLEVFGLRARPLRIFGCVALGVVIADPLAVVDVGAWLSFGATLGIIVMAPLILDRLPGAKRPVLRPMMMLLSATIAAELMLIPISAAVFSRVGAAGLLLNFVAIPAMTVAQVAGSMAALLLAIWPAAASAAGSVAALGAALLLRTGDVVTFVPWLSWQTPPVSAFWTATYYGAGLAALTWPHRRAVRRAAIAVAATCLAVIVTSPNLSPAAPAHGRLRVAILDVGQGDAIAVQFPTGQSLLVDAGTSSPGFDTGARIVQPALWSLGIRRLDWLALTHGDLDHAGGAASVLRDLRPREVWEGVPVWRDPRVQGLRAAAQQSGAAWRRLVKGDAFEVGSVLVDAMHPPLPDWERQKIRNDDSIVLRLRFGSIAVWLTGDIGVAVEAGLPTGDESAAALRILKVPHHGSRTSSSPPFLRALLPHVALVSAGRGNTFGHPAPDVLTRYEQLGIEVFRTDRDGAIIIETDGRDADIRTAGGRRYRLSYTGS